jgi:Raf kinase inhibitor-like YbhB/YbcL family protein
MATSSDIDKSGAGTFTLRSSELGGQFTNDQYYNDLGFSGANISPQLSWKNEPEGTKSFAVTIHDPDAPTQSGFWHWFIFNIPNDVHELKTNSGNPESNLAPSGSVQLLNDYGNQGFGGAAPNEGSAHRYIITVHALSKILKFDQNTSPAFVAFNMFFITIQKASLLVYGKK